MGKSNYCWATTFCDKDGPVIMKKAMYKLEKKRTKFFICCCFAVSAIIFLVLGAIWAMRSINQSRIAADYGYKAYDMCLQPD